MGDGSRLYICGTNAHNPKDWVVNVSHKQLEFQRDRNNNKSKRLPLTSLIICRSTDTTGSQSRGGFHTWKNSSLATIVAIVSCRSHWRVDRIKVELNKVKRSGGATPQLCYYADVELRLFRPIYRRYNP
jgi:hypothetical protein